MKNFKLLKRILAMFVTVLIVVTSIQLPVFADTQQPYEWEGTTLKVNLYNNLTMSELSQAINEIGGELMLVARPLVTVQTQV